jgi:hypothetical protein
LTSSCVNWVFFARLGQFKTRVHTGENSEILTVSNKKKIIFYYYVVLLSVPFPSIKLFSFLIKVQMSSKTHNVLLFFLKFINYPEEKHYRQTLDMNCDQLIHLIIVGPVYRKRIKYLIRIKF